jgi:predicted lipid-binding transport protein (Tim44 family)
MHQGLQFLDIIFLALIAGFLFFRLRSVLGRRTGEERPPTNPYAGRSKTAGAPERDDIIRPLPAPEAHRAGPATVDARLIVDSVPGIAQIRALDPTFDAARFLEGARSAHEMVIGAFANADRGTLRDLLAPEVFEGFDAVLRDREAKDQHAETTLVEAQRTEIVSAEARAREARVTVRFVSEIISCVKDSEGRIVEGHPTVPHVVTDIWTFSRDSKSRDPNWILAATAGEA